MSDAEKTPAQIIDEACATYEAFVTARLEMIEKKNPAALNYCFHKGALVSKRRLIPKPTLVK